MKYIFFTLLAFPIVSSSQNHKQFRMIDSVFNNYFSGHEPGGSLLVVVNNNILFNKGLGIADLETGENITSKTLFNLGSISKPIVSFGILKLASEKKLSLEDDILKYFPDFKNKDIAKKVKIYHLLTHTSGLPDSRKVQEEHEFYLTAKDEENFAPLKLTDSLEFEPGSRYKYSNPAFNGLALIIEQVSGMKWQEYIQKNIFEPAGMLNSTITDGPHPMTGVSHAYVKKGNIFEELDYGEEPTFAAAGNGGVWSNVEELWLLEKAIQDQKFLAPEWILRSRTIYPLNNWLDSTPSRLGLSWFLTRELNSEMIGHTGSQGGFISDYVWIPEKKIFYVLLCNTPKPISEIRQKILALLDE